MTSPETDEAIVAYLDDAMDEPARSAFTARCAGDPELARRVEAHRWLGHQIAAAFGPAPIGTISPELFARLGLADDKVAPWHLPASFGRLLVPVGALAASLAVGIWLGGLRSSGPDVLTIQRGGHAVASGSLSQALSSQLSGEPGPVRVAMTIHTASGPCRTFVIAQGVSGLACRSGQQWEVPVITSVQASTPATGEYRLAGGDVSPTVMAEVDRRIVGEPVGPDEERGLLLRHWH